jgi:acid phosphatase class B
MIKSLNAILILSVLFLGRCSDNKKLNTSENVEIVTKFFEEGHNKQNPELADMIIADNYVKYNNGYKVDGEGPQVLKDAINMHITNNNRFRFIISETISEEEKVVARWRWEAENIKFGKPINVTAEGMSIFYIKNGKIEKLWQVFDLYDFFKSLGYTITPPESS